MFSSLVEELSRLAKELDKNGLKLSPSSPTDEPSEESQPPDPDRLRDDRNFDDGVVCTTAEKTDSLYVPLDSAEEVNLKYFLDGTLSTIYWGDIISSSTYIRPVMVSNIAIAIVRKEGKRCVIESTDNSIVVLVPYTETDPEWEAFNAFTKGYLEVVPLKEPPLLADDLRSKLAAKAKSVLHEKEADAMFSLTKASEEWAVIDGDIRERRFFEIPNIIGVAKSFSLKPILKYSPAKQFSVLEIARQLPEKHRTPVFQKSSGEYSRVGFWYLRLRDSKCLDYYYQGIVKVEIFLTPETTKSLSETANAISRSLFNERFPTIYPNRRWHAHLYPVYTAETIAKTNIIKPVILRQVLFQSGKGFDL